MKHLNVKLDLLLVNPMALLNSTGISGFTALVVFSFNISLIYWRLYLVLGLIWKSRRYGHFCLVYVESVTLRFSPFSLPLCIV